MAVSTLPVLKGLLNACWPLDPWPHGSSPGTLTSAKPIRFCLFKICDTQKFWFFSVGVWTERTGKSWGSYCMSRVQRNQESLREERKKKRDWQSEKQRWEAIGVGGVGDWRKATKEERKRKRAHTWFSRDTPGCSYCPPHLLRLLGEPDVRHLLSSLSLAHWLFSHPSGYRHPSSSFYSWRREVWSTLSGKHRVKTQTASLCLPGEWAWLQDSGDLGWRGNSAPPQSRYLIQLLNLWASHLPLL